MTVVDTELPYALIDLALGFVATIMGAILMCISAGYFTATMPPVMLIVWGKSKSCYIVPLVDDISAPEILSENFTPNAPSRS